MTVERWCSMKEVCEHLGASHDSVVHWVKNNNLPAVKIGKLWRFKMSEVDEWLQSDDAERTKAGKQKWNGNTRISFKPLFKLLIDRDIRKKDLAEMANISIATITKMGKDGSHVQSDVLERICLALGCKIGDIVQIVKTDDPEITGDPTEKIEPVVLDTAACEEYGLSETDQEIVHFIYEQLKYYRECPPRFMVNQVRSEMGTASPQEAISHIPTDGFYSLVLNEVLEYWGHDGSAFARKHIPFQTIESGYFEPEEQSFGGMKFS